MFVLLERVSGPRGWPPAFRKWRNGRRLPPPRRRDDVRLRKHARLRSHPRNIVLLSACGFRHFGRRGFAIDLSVHAVVPADRVD